MSREDVLRENKRECFDGMRAYHQSEISHANRAITMLLAMAAAVGAVAVKVLFLEVPLDHVYGVVWGIFIVVLVFGGAIAGAAHIKISKDHEVYANFGAEYVRTCKLLGLYDPVSNGRIVSSDAIKNNENIGQGKGYRHTQSIIWSFACILVVLTLLFAIFIPYIL